MANPYELATPGSQIFQDNPLFKRPDETPDAFKTRVGWQEPSTQVYSRLPETAGTPISAIDTKRSELERTIFEGAKPIDENAIREEKRKNAQSVIDAITQQYNRTLQEEMKAGMGRENRTRAINVASGLGGSDFASANAIDTENKNKEIYQSVEAERDAKINAVLAGVDESASAEIAARREQQVGNAEKALAILADNQDKARTYIKELASAGVKLEALKAKEPERYQRLIEMSGDDPMLVEAMFNQAAAAGSKVDYTYHSLGDGRVLRTGKRADGTAVPEELFNYPSLTKDMQLVLTPDGTPLIFDKQTGEARIAPGFRESQFMKPESSGDGGTGGGGTLGGDNPQLYSGLSTKTATAVRAKVAAFKTEPMVQNFATIQDGYKFATSFPNDTKNPADDQALIYALAKALDPGSVVREGEYATAQKYSQSWVKAFGKGVEQAASGTGFLSDTARRNIKATIESRYNASKASYENVQKQYAGNIDSLTGRKDGTKFLVDYAIPQEQASNDDLDYTIRQNAGRYQTREQLIDALVSATGLSKDAVAGRVYSVIPDKK